MRRSAGCSPDVLGLDVVPQSAQGGEGPGAALAGGAAWRPRPDAAQLSGELLGASTDCPVQRVAVKEEGGGDGQGGLPAERRPRKGPGGPGGSCSPLLKAPGLSSSWSRLA